MDNQLNQELGRNINVNSLKFLQKKLKLLDLAAEETFISGSELTTDQFTEEAVLAALQDGSQMMRQMNSH